MNKWTSRAHDAKEPRKGLIHSVLTAGIDPALGLEDRIAARLGNTAAFLAFFMAIAWSAAAYPVTGSLTLTLASLIFAICYLGSYLLMVGGYRRTSRMLLSVMLSFHLAFVASIVGPQSGIEFNAVLIISILIVIYAKQERRDRLLAFSAFAISILVMAYVFANFEPMIALSAESKQLGYFLTVLLVSVYTGIVMYIMHYSSIDNVIELRDERNRSDEILKDLLPDLIAEKLKHGDRIIADSHGDAAILFADLVGFSKLTRRLSPRYLVGLLNVLFSDFDEISAEKGVEKIKTIGDCYMAATGVVRDDDEVGVASLFELALGILQSVDRIAAQYGIELQVRIGISTGQVISGVIGKNKKSFDLWGAAVNLASQMEVTGIGGAIQVTESAYLRLKDRWRFERRDDVVLKTANPMPTFVYLGPL